MLHPHRAGLILFVALAAWATPARAHQAYYGDFCAGCHSSTVQTCNGCHSHGTHSGATKSDINLAVALDKGTYAPGATVTVTITGGYQSGWFRALLLDAGMKELARSSCPGSQGGCATTGYPVTLTAAAPTSPGTYTWAIAWYGNYAHEGTGASFGSGTSSTLRAGYFTADASNPDHGYQVVALPAFTVSGAGAPAIGVAPTSLAFGTVSVGASATKTVTLTSTGTGTLTGGVAVAQGTSSEYSVSPATFSLAPGASQTVTVTYAPADTTSDTGSLVVTSDDAARPSVSVALQGTGTATALPTAALSPASLDFGSVTVGASASQAVQLQNTGVATLTVTSIARCGSPATSTEFGWTALPQPFTIAAGQSVTLTATYAPADAGADTGCLVVTSDDLQNPTLALSVRGSGTQPSGGAPSSGGCSSGAGGSASTLLVLLAALGMRGVAWRRRAKSSSTSAAGR
ncbi:choice-of-anchor D domain-containing protein [Anaeromyxobacter terrae]|uniref:choice-of-anchor D domain-containing protein n=1 Tax=Anaeromyxobacter terrae TaxID=2925406 RepID=UPI001F5835E9|nr:choice-of-anchor D domain-containing protein [Anaeromyxobacter sp. SG22]